MVTPQPRPNMTGVLSLETKGQGLAASSSLLRQSEICAPCHDASFWGTPIYESFAEWLASPYASRGVTCQACHMRREGTNVTPDHRFPGAADPTLLREAVTTVATAERVGGDVVVRVAVTNDKAGHHVPTGSPLRQLILLVRAVDVRARDLPLVEGPTVPAWGGMRASVIGHYAGHPGKGFAKILRETWTGYSPTAAYWNPTQIVSDNRIAAFDTDTSEYRFDSSRGDQVRVEVELLFRRAFIDLAMKKGWPVPDILLSRHCLDLEDPARSQP